MKMQSMKEKSMMEKTLTIYSLLDNLMMNIKTSDSAIVSVRTARCEIPKILKGAVFILVSWIIMLYQS